MYSKEAFEALTVVELRKIARENGVTLSAGISKQGIVERLCDALIKEEPAQTTPQSAPENSPPIARRVASIVTDDEDTPVLTPNAPFVRSAPAKPVPAARPVRTPVQSAAPAQPTVNRGNVPGTNKPVFSLEGVRAWHNPRNYSQPGSNNTYSQQQRPASSYGQQRSFPTVSRFGPDAGQPAKEVPSQENAYRSEPRQPYSAPQGTEVRPAGYPQQPSYQQGSYQNDYRPRTAAPGALPEMLAAGDISDGSGVLEIHQEGYGFLRMDNYLPGRNDIYVSNAQIRRFKLRNGDHITGKVRPQRENDRYGALLYITEINGTDPEDTSMERVSFESLTAEYPSRPMTLCKANESSALLRAIDLLSPIGFGQRALITVPDGMEPDSALAEIAQAIHSQHDKAQLITLLLGKRPEDVTLARESLPGDVLCVSFDETADSLLRVADMALERAMRIAEQKKDAVLVIDSLSALVRAGNEAAPQSAVTLPGGITVPALNRARHLFGAARALREGGTLTILAVLGENETALTDELSRLATARISLTENGLIKPCRSFTRKAERLQTQAAHEKADSLRAAIQKEGCKNGADRLAALLEMDGSNAKA